MSTHTKPPEAFLMNLPSKQELRDAALRQMPPQDIDRSFDPPRIYPRPDRHGPRLMARLRVRRTFQLMRGDA